MSVGAVDPMTGLPEPDPNATAAEALAALPAPAVPGGASPFPMPSPNPDDYPPQQGAPGAGGPHTPAAAGSTPASATDAELDRISAPATPQFAQLPPPPAPPKLSGDPAKDVAANVDYQRQLTDYHGQLVAHQNELSKHAAGIQQQQADREAEVERDAQVARQAEQAAYQEQRDQRQAAIDKAVGEREAAHQDLEGANWADKHTGAALVAAIAGGLGAAFQNAAAAQLGQVGHAQNEGMNTVNRLIEMDYRKRKDRLASAGDAVMEARYGFKDAADNHRAALNELDADTASKYRLAAKEAEAQLRESGADDATAKSNEVVVGLLKSAADAEGKIHQREEEMAGQRQHYRAEEALANANLSIARGHLSLSRDEANTRHEDRVAAREDKKAAAGEKHDDELAQRTVADQRGKPLGLVPKGSRALKDNIAKDISTSVDYVKAANDLADHIEKHGYILNPISEEAKERESLAGNVQSLGRQVKGIQASDAGQQLEHQIIGGTGILTKGFKTASPAVIRKLAQEGVDKMNDRLRSSLQPLPGESVARAVEYDKPGSAARDGFDAGGGVRYEKGADGNYHKVK